MEAQDLPIVRPRKTRRVDIARRSPALYKVLASLASRSRDLKWAQLALINFTT